MILRWIPLMLFAMTAPKLCIEAELLIQLLNPLLNLSCRERILAFSTPCIPNFVNCTLKDLRFAGLEFWVRGVQERGSRELRDSNHYVVSNRFIP